MLNKIEKCIRYIEKVFMGIICVIFMLLMFLGVSDVAGRYFFNSPILGTMEASEIMMAGIVLLGLAYTQKINGHVRVDLITSRYPPRVQAVVNFASLLVSFVLYVVICWQSLILAIQCVEENRAFQILPGPSAPYHFFVPIGAFILCLEIVLQIIRAVPEMRRGGKSCPQ